MLKRLFIFMFGLLPLLGMSNGGYFVENKGQYPENVLYAARLNYGAFFIEKDRFTVVVLDPDQVDHTLGHPSHDHNHHQKSMSGNISDINGHSFSIQFEGSAGITGSKGSKPLGHKVNYLLGQDASKWAQDLIPYQEVTLSTIYPNTDLRVSFKDNSIKYDFILKPGASPEKIRLKYEGLEAIHHKGKELELITSVGKLTDSTPFSYSVGHPERKLKTKFKKIAENTFGIDVKWKSNSETLIIDPQINFVTFTGATVDNWGYTATYDEGGYGYGGGVVFGAGYPTTTGAFQSTYGGGSIDISISKFSPDGSNLIYATYIGGSGLEAPHSMIVNSRNELVVYGITSSTDYPITAFSYDKTHDGGYTILASNVLNYVGGTDIIVTVLNSSGNGISGSTYFGGSSNDGLNDAGENSGLFYNYGDIYRGEVIVDGADNIIIASVTESSDITMSGGFQTSFGGGNQDGCVAKFSPDLSNIIWSSYFGGSGDDACYAAKLNSSEEVYITGGTTSSNLPVSGGANNPAYNGKIDGFLARINSAGSSVTNCTYVGTSDYDQSFFVEVDKDDDVYCFGQSLGNMPVSSGAYSVPNSAQFLHKYPPNLSNISASTVIGDGSQAINIVPGAFMVSNCKEVYLSGWGGAVNYKLVSTTNGLPTTPDAVQPSTDGSDFYLGLLGQDFSSLKYGTFLGGSTLSEHVDGGTSRFDRDGTVYQAVCAGCGGSSAFPVTPTAYSTTNNASNCNLALIKMDISKLTANIKFTKDSVHCKNEPVNFYNESTGGTTYKWIYPDGSVSVGFDGEYYFQDTGNYVVSLIAIDSTQCPYADTADINVKIITIPDIKIDIDTFVCLNDSLLISTIGGPNDTNYTWWTLEGPLNGNTRDITVAPKVTTEYAVQHTNECGNDVATVEVPVYHPPKGKFQIDTVCDYESIEFPFTSYPDFQTTAPNGESFNIDGSIIEFPTNGSQVIYLETTGNCGDAIDTFDITVVEINPSAGPDTLICPGERVKLWAFGGDEYQWQTSYSMDDSTLQFPTVSPQETHDYIVNISSWNCLKTDTARVKVFPKPYQPVEPEYTIDYGESVPISLNTNYNYNWNPGTYLSCKVCPNTVSKPEEDITYYFTYKNDQSCAITDSIKIKVIFPLYVPNTFTPNDDGTNEKFYAYSHLLKSFEMDIFDRWGNHIFHTNNIKEGWDGTFKGRPQQQDVYVWKINYVKVHTNTTLQMVGHVNLIR